MLLMSDFTDARYEALLLVDLNSRSSPNWVSALAQRLRRYSPSNFLLESRLACKLQLVASVGVGHIFDAVASHCMGWSLFVGCE